MAKPQPQRQRSREYYRDFFLEADTDHSGYLSFQELLQILRRKGYTGRESELKGLFQKADLSGDNKLSLLEFMTAMEAVGEDNHKAAMMRVCFRQYDENNDGKIDRNELDQAFLDMGKLMHQTDLDRIMKSADKDGSGALDYEEFIALMFPDK